MKKPIKCPIKLDKSVTLGVPFLFGGLWVSYNRIVVLLIVYMCIGAFDFVPKVWQINV